MQAEQRTQGRAAVRDTLIDRSLAAGLSRRRGVTVDEFDDMQKRLCERLAYMSRANLETLAEIVIENGEGSKHNTWPAEATIIRWANDPQRSGRTLPVFGALPTATSWRRRQSADP